MLMVCPNAILLMPVMRFNEPAVKDYFAVAYDRVVHDGDRSLPVDEKSQYILSELDRIVKVLEIPTSLKDFGVPESDLEDLVQASMKVTRLLVNNQREITADDAREIYKQVL